MAVHAVLGVARRHLFVLVVPPIIGHASMTLRVTASTRAIHCVRLCS